MSGNHSLRIFVDHSSVEVFANDGQAVITDLIYPDVDSKGISAHAENTELVFSSLQLYEVSPTKVKGEL